MMADGIHHALAHFRSRPIRLPPKRFEQSVFSEILPTAVRCLGDAIAEDEQPIPGQ